MNTKKKITIRYKYGTQTNIQHVVIDRTIDRIIGIIPTYEEAHILVKILNRSHKAHITTPKEGRGRDGSTSSNPLYNSITEKKEI